MALWVRSTTGDVLVSKNFKFSSIDIDDSTSDVDLENVIISNKMDISLSTGDVNFNISDALEIKVKVSTGDVTGNLLSSKIFYAETSTGRKDVPKKCWWYL